MGKPSAERAFNLDLLKDEIEAHLGGPAIALEEIKAGGNGCLFRVDLADGRQVVAKYYQNDDRNRLGHEFTGLAFLNEQNFEDVPKAYFANPAEQVGVYSFEPGETRSPDQYTDEQLRAMADFLVRVHQYRPADVHQPLMNSLLPCFSWPDYAHNIQHRLDHFQEALAMGTLAPEVTRRTRQLGLDTLVPRLIQRVMDSMSADERDWVLAPEHHRLSPIDFGPHNILIQSGGKLCFIDFEYFGWDDPLRVVADCVTHDQMQSAGSRRQIIVDRYLERVGLPEQELARMPRVIELMNIEWIAVFLFGLTPHKIAIRRFANAEFELDSYVDKLLVKLQQRVNDVMAQ